MRKGKVRILILTALLLGAAVLGTAQKPPGVPVTYELSIVIEGSGTVTVNPPPLEGETSFTGNARINYSHPEGESITVGLQAEPAAGYAFVRWVLRKPDGSTTTVGSSTTNMELYYDEAWGTFSEWSARAVFVPEYTLTVGVEGQGTTTPSAGTHKYLEDTVVNLAAQPSANWGFSHWVGPVADPSSPNTTVKMDADKTVTAHFTKVTLHDLLHTYDGTPKEASVTTEPPGLDVTITYNGAPNPPVDAGNYTVVATIDDPDYVGSATGTLTIEKRPIEVTADNKSKVYGQADPPLTYQVTAGSLAAGDSFTGALSRVAGENAGTYTIQQGTLSIDKIANYDLTFVPGTLTIRTGELIITADDKQKTFDEQPFTDFTVSYEGFVEGDGPRDLGGTLSFSGDAVGAVEVGKYTITPGGLTSPNYDITFVSGRLTIHPHYDVAPAGAAGTFMDRAVVGGVGMFEDILIEALYEIGMPIIVSFTISDFYGEEVTDAIALVTLVGTEGKPKPVVYLGVASYDEELGLYYLEIPTDELQPNHYFLSITLEEGSHFQELFELVEPNDQNNP